MERRHYLGVVASALLAGCTDDEQPATETETTPADPAPTEPPTSTTSIETDQPTETRTEQETETETPERPNEDLESIAADVTTAVDRYESYGSDDSLTDVRPSDAVVLSSVRDPLYDARERRDDVEPSSLPADEQARYDRLTGAYWFTWWLGLTHDALHDAYRRLEGGWDAILEEEWDEAESEWAAAGQSADEAADFLDKLESESTADDMAVFDSVTAADYDEKVAQLDAHVTDSESLASALVTVADGFQLYASRGEFSNFRAEREFSNAAETLRETNWEPTYGDLVDDAICVADAMAAGCQRLDEARRADDPDRAELLRGQATDEFNDCDIVEEEIDV